MTIEASDWEVQTLEPLSWIEVHGVVSGGSLALAEVVDLAEMGVPEQLGWDDRVDLGVSADRGRHRAVVLTTVNHLNDFLYNLTLSDSQGDTDNLGVTGYHRFYTEDRGWVIASELFLWRIGSHRQRRCDGDELDS